MTEDEAREAVLSRVGTGAFGRLEALVELVVAESANQNLIARSTIGSIWVRHILDSVQLIAWSGPAQGLWVDIGTGGGFPGLAVAAVTQASTVLVEPRRLRAAFLETAAQRLALPHTRVRQTKIENVSVEGTVISARAVAPIENLLQAAARCATPTTRWLFPRGNVLPEEIRSLARRLPTMVFHVEQSVSDPASSIVVAAGRP